MDFQLDEAIAILERTPAVVFALLKGASDELLNSREGDGTFSPIDVLGHFIHGEQTDWLPRTRIILESGEAQMFEPFDMSGHEAVIHGKSGNQLLVAFAALRKQNLKALRQLNLDEAKLDRTGMHPALGRVTLRNMLASWVVHDLSHTAQIARIMARQYGDNVGPWRPRMTILVHPERAVR